MRSIGRDVRTIKKLMRSWAKYKKKIAQGKLKKKNSFTPINPKKYSRYGLKKIHTRNMLTEKKFLRLENSSPPITFLMVRP